MRNALDKVCQGLWLVERDQAAKAGPFETFNARDWANDRSRMIHRRAVAGRLAMLPQSGRFSIRVEVSLACVHGAMAWVGWLGICSLQRHPWPLWFLLCLCWLLRGGIGLRIDFTFFFFDRFWGGFLALGCVRYRLRTGEMASNNVGEPVR